MHCGSSGYGRDHLKMAQIKAKTKVEKPWLIEDVYGFYQWDCPHCWYKMVTMSKQHVASARSNHLRTHNMIV